MKLLAIFVLFFSLYSSAMNAITSNCDYSYYGAPFANVKLYFDETGTLNPLATITNTGARPHNELVESIQTTSGESFHGWISRNTSNEIEILIFSVTQNGINSVLINHNVPMAKKIWGTCNTQFNE